MPKDQIFDPLGKRPSLFTFSISPVNRYFFQTDMMVDEGILKILWTPQVLCPSYFMWTITCLISLEISFDFLPIFLKFVCRRQKFEYYVTCSLKITLDTFHDILLPLIRVTALLSYTTLSYNVGIIEKSRILLSWRCRQAGRLKKLDLRSCS